MRWLTLRNPYVFFSLAAAFFAWIFMLLALMFFRKVYKNGHDSSDPEPTFMQLFTYLGDKLQIDWMISITHSGSAFVQSFLTMNTFHYLVFSGIILLVYQFTRP